MLNRRWWTWVGLFAVLWILAFWPGSLGPLIGRPRNEVNPLVFGWMPGWFFYQLVIYYLVVVAAAAFTFVELLPHIRDEED